MNADLSMLLFSGVLAIAVAVTALVLLVRGDLAPAQGAGKAQWRGGGRWFLGAALGVGVIAFTIKVAVILVLANFPDRTVAPLIAGVGRIAPPGAIDMGGGPVRPPLSFRALPEVVPEPSDNPSNPDKVALGQRLFHDPALSRGRTVSCASCHDVDRGAGADGRPTAVGVTGVPGRRNAPSVYNAAYQARLFWDGRAASLEDQAMGPPLNSDEMGMASPAAIEQQVAAEPGYVQAFARAFGDDRPISFRRIAQAIAAYERTLVTADSPYDRFVTGDATALNPAQQRGMWLFQTIGCVNCHAGPNFSGASLVGPRNPYAPFLVQRSEAARRHNLDDDKGRAGPEAKEGIWRVPSLRNVALTAPYFHNGSVADLREAVRVMAGAQLAAQIGGDPRQGRVPRWSPERGIYETVERVVLDERDLDDLVAFLHGLSSERLVTRMAAAQ